MLLRPAHPLSQCPVGVRSHRCAECPLSWRMDMEEVLLVRVVEAVVVVAPLQA